ncbi:MAG: transglycosylase SLT domain-containing protein [Candidatus Gastranaerophilales bacterium]|nr:transglycosylase SLT domain-containing protein [Candidatus Gastranaerophilales bacterium]
MRKLNILSGIIFLTLIIVGVLWNLNCLRVPVFSTSDNRIYYEEGLNYQQNKEYKKAYYTFRKISSSYPAYEAVLLRLAECAANVGDENTAIEKHNKLISKYPKSIFAPKASYAIGQAYMRKKNYKQAQNQFVATIKHYPSTDYAIASHYYLGQIYKNTSINIAVDYWKKYLMQSPNGRFSLNCISELINAKANLNELDNLNFAIAYYNAGEYEKAKKYINQTNYKFSQYYRGKIYQMQGQKQAALSNFYNYIKNYSNTQDKWKIWDAMLSYVSLSPDSKYTSWDKIDKIAQGHRDFILYNKAKTAASKNLSIGLYKQLIQKFPDSNFASESMWNIFWNEYENKRYNSAISIAKKHLKDHENTKATPKMLFWLGKIYEKQGKKSQAAKLYRDLAKNYSDDYYAFRASGRLNYIYNGKDSGWNTDKKSVINDKLYSPEKPFDYNKIKKEKGELIAELFELKDYDLISDLQNYDGFIQSWVSLKQGLTSRSSVLARDAVEELFPRPDKENTGWQLVYPIYYADLINTYASQNKLDANLVIALIREESYFNPYAISASDARGLMQLMPMTANDIVRWYKFEQFNKKDLFNPEMNIKIGTAYLNHLKQYFNNNMICVIGSYNGGPGAVQKWLNTIKYDDFDEFIEKIPYSETQNYIKKVFRSYWNYQEIYGKK